MVGLREEGEVGANLFSSVEVDVVMDYMILNL